MSQAGHAIDFEIAAHLLALDTFYTSRQIHAGIHLLTERASLYFDERGRCFEYPYAVSEPVPLDPDSDVDPVHVFRSLLGDVLGARPISNPALELSGGLDSSTVAIAAVEQWGNYLVSGSAVLDGSPGIAQGERRKTLMNALQLDDETVQMAAAMPDLNLNGDSRDREHPCGEFYLEAFNELWEKLRRRGCYALLTGVGGDELFPSFSFEPRSDQPTSTHGARKHAEVIMTDRACDAARSMLLFNAPRGPVPVTSLLGNVCRAPYLLRQGLWLINPLCNPLLVAFCHGLPAQLRLRRQLMRDMMSYSLKTDLFPPAYRKETFDYVLPVAVAAQAAMLHHQLHDCALADLGLVDVDRVKDLLNLVAQTRDVDAIAPLAFFLFLERFIRQTGGA